MMMMMMIIIIIIIIVVVVVVVFVITNSVVSLHWQTTGCRTGLSIRQNVSATVDI